MLLQQQILSQPGKNRWFSIKNQVQEKFIEKLQHQLFNTIHEKKLHECSSSADKITSRPNNQIMIITSSCLSRFERKNISIKEKTSMRESSNDLISLEVC